MRRIFALLLFFAISSYLIAQQNEKINVIIDDDTNISLVTEYQQKITNGQQFEEWITSLPNKVTGKIEYINSNTGDFRYIGCVPIYFSEKTSVFQTRMHFTLLIQTTENKIILTIKNIFYQSYPEYGKQGTPAIISYPKDWYSKTKLRKKSNALPWLNQMVKENTISTAKELLTSGYEFFN
ncbi:hypothetical protein BZG02_03515 [Labilibaculum filiforme]|uniref:DUF4468 domain-containing protein n=1 Tax=Labilibaculum filiforme TaxID=1940526 RepID=A0A2N3I3P7_9BACT|nr:DUF4468 domain-containing protein [Labilibaculum filiforme]PKQ64928.1 hypothetical protein BZG02_03515 [Labilibaculum filiforme]